jgi:superfamily II DNA or RNA helicase
MLEPLIPTDEQEAAIEQMVNSPTSSALSGSGLGTGKTVMAVEVALRRGAKTVLVVAPLHTKYGWQATIQRQTLYTVTPRFIDSRNKAGKQALADVRAGLPGFYIIGREYFRLLNWDKVKLDMLILDEVHVFSNRKTKGYNVAVDLAKRSGYVLAQSATWFGSAFSGAWSIGRIVFPEDTPRAFWKFVDQYCSTVWNRFDPSGKQVVGEAVPGAFARSLPCYVNLESKSIDPPLVQEVYVDLTVKQRRLYDEFEREGLVWLESMPMAATVPIVQRIRLRQLTLAECTVTETGEIDFPEHARSSKFDALQEMLDDLPDEPVLIATDSAKYARWVAARLGDGAFAWTGDKSEKERETAKQKFIQGDLQYIVATQASISEGTDNLQLACHIMIELSQNDSPLLNTQMMGRLARTGQTQRVIVYRILGRETIDDEQNETLLTKALRMRQSMLKEEVAA